MDRLGEIVSRSKDQGSQSRFHLAAAWVATVRPSLSVGQLADVLRFSATDLAPAGWDERTGFGLVTEKLEGVTFVQRRFHSAQEYAQTVASLKAQGIEAEGKETEGLYHAELYVSRPQRDVEEQPLRELVSITSGAHRRYGRRFAKAPDGKVKLMN